MFPMHRLAIYLNDHFAGATLGAEVHAVPLQRIEVLSSATSWRPCTGKSSTNDRRFAP